MAIDFQIARMKHRGWKAVMNSFVEFGVKVPEDRAVDARDCDLGKWLHSEAMDRHKNLTEMSELERIHTSLHNRVKKIIVLKDSGDVDQAKREFDELENESDRVIDLLSTVEKKIN